VDRHYVAIAALNALAAEGALPKSKVEAAIKKYGVDAERPPPWKI
jgi:pyruvate dehydrogenase E1 component